MDFLRDTTFGRTTRWISGKKLFLHPEEKPGFVLPTEYQLHLDGGEKFNGAAYLSNLELEPRPISHPGGGDMEALQNASSATSTSNASFAPKRPAAEPELGLQLTRSIPIVPMKTSDGITLVDWYTTDDPANPQNWSSFKRSWIVFVMSMYTMIAYMAGSLYSTSEPGVQAQFGVGSQTVLLGLSMFVLAYGIGPLIFGPITEIPIIGRGWVYSLSFIVTFILGFPTATVNNFSGLIALRFFQGFFGSVGIAIGGASVGDVIPFLYFPYGLTWWILAFWWAPPIGYVALLQYY
jgi:DHA1 family multidrug resistance protein-like MFS transporter